MYDGDDDGDDDGRWIVSFVKAADTYYATWWLNKQKKQDKQPDITSRRQMSKKNEVRLLNLTQIS